MVKERICLMVLAWLFAFSLSAQDQWKNVYPRLCIRKIEGSVFVLDSIKQTV